MRTQANPTFLKAHRAQHANFDDLLCCTAHLTKPISSQERAKRIARFKYTVVLNTYVHKHTHTPSYHQVDVSSNNYTAVCIEFLNEFRLAKQIMATQRRSLVVIKWEYLQGKFIFIFCANSVSMPKDHTEVSRSIFSLNLNHPATNCLNQKAIHWPSYAINVITFAKQNN